MLTKFRLLRLETSKLDMFAWSQANSVEPSGLKEIANSPVLKSVILCTLSAVATSHKHTDLSSLPEASMAPFGVKATQVTAAECPRN